MHKAIKPPKQQRLSANPQPPVEGLTTRLGQHARRDNATEKQMNYLRDLVAKAEMTTEQRQAAEKMMGDGLTKTQASAWIERAKQMPRRRQQQTQRSNGRSDVATSEAARGMYRAPDGRVIRVYLGQQSGRNLCKQLVDTGQPHPEDPSINLHDWEYLGAAEYKLPADSKRMTLEEAKEFGRMTGSCCRCGRRLDVPESVERGIGPVCGRKKHWVAS